MNLKTTYMGLALKNPIVPAASPLSKWLDGMKRMEDAGAGAITMFSLFEEQIEHEMALLGEMLDYGAESFAEATSYFPEPESYHRGPEEYLALIADAKETLDIPVIASLNGCSTGGWVDYARQIEQAGASALELNVNWVETRASEDGRAVEQRYLDVVEAVSGAVSLPVAVKVGPAFSSVANMARRFEEKGAKGLVLFNRFYQPDFDIPSREVKPSLAWSNPHEIRLPLHWTSILHGQVGLNIAISTGVHGATEVIKALLAGATIATCASCLMERGVRHLSTMVQGLEVWMKDQEYESVDEFRGAMSLRRVANPGAFERANYMKELQSFRPDPSLLWQ